MNKKIKRVLVVDDEHMILVSCMQILKMRNYGVDSAYSVKEAKEKLEREYFHMVISDIELPGETGMDLLRHIKDKHTDTGVILMTGRLDIDSKECINNGAFDYIQKPFEMQDFLNKVGKYFEDGKE